MTGTEQGQDGQPRRDFRDLQDELACRETGRQKRFLPEDEERNPRNAEKKRDETFDRALLLQQAAHGSAGFTLRYGPLR